MLYCGLTYLWFSKNIFGRCCYRWILKILLDATTSVILKLSPLGLQLFYLNCVSPQKILFFGRLRVVRPRTLLLEWTSQHICFWMLLGWHSTAATVFVDLCFQYYISNQIITKNLFKLVPNLVAKFWRYIIYNYFCINCITNIIYLT